MKESYDEGLANHISLESCGDHSNVVAEALTEGSTGGLLSSEITCFRMPTTWSGWEGNMICSDMRVAEQSDGVLEPGMCGHSLRGNREIHDLASREVRTGKEKVRNLVVYGSWKSDNNIVPEKPVNKKTLSLRNRWREGRWPKGIL